MKYHINKDLTQMYTQLFRGFLIARPLIALRVPLGGEAVVPGPHTGIGALYDGVDLLVGREDAGSEREGDEAQTGEHQHLQSGFG